MLFRGEATRLSSGLAGLYPCWLNAHGRQVRSEQLAWGVIPHNRLGPDGMFEAGANENSMRGAWMTPKKIQQGQTSRPVFPLSSTSAGPTGRSHRACQCRSTCGRVCDALIA